MLTVEEISDAVFCADSAQILKEFPSESIDCIITSPPYDTLRWYNGAIKKRRVDPHSKTPNYSFDFETIARELTRVLKDGGILVWIVGSETIDGCESLTPLDQTIFFVRECGLNLHDTMGYEKNGASYPAQVTGNRYTQIWEYMYVFSKGKPKHAKLIVDKKNRWIGWKGFGKTTQRNKDGALVAYEKKQGTPEYSPRYNIWRYATGRGYSSKFETASEQPAIFPEPLVFDHLRTWTREGDMVLDPFAGSGTTLAVAKAMNRHYVGIEICQDYCNIIKERLEADCVDLEWLEEISKRINNQRYPQDEHRKV